MTTSLLRPASALLCLAALALLALPARAGDVDVLLQEWEIVSRRVDERGWQEQAKLLNKLADMRTREARKALKKLRERHGKGDWRRTTLILGAMLRHATPDEIDEVVRWVEKRRDPYLTENLGAALAEASGAEARGHLRGKALQRATPAIKAQIARSCGLARDLQAVPALLKLLDEKLLRVKVEALDALAVLGDRRAVTPIIVFLKDKDPRVRDAAAEALGFLGDQKAVIPLVQMLGDEDARVAESVALALGRIGDPEAIPALLVRLEKSLENDLRLADAISIALEAVTGKKIGIDLERWQDWWEAIRDKPWKRADPEKEPPEGRTVPANWYYDIPVLSSRLVFVLDVSRSMGWNKRLEKAKQELMKVVDKLPERTHFNIITYSDGVGAWKRELQPAKKLNKRKAKKFVERLGPQNGTNTWEALRTAFQDPAVDTIMFLSDGHPSTGTIIEPDLILAELREMNRYRRVRIHVIALLQGDPPTGFAGTEDMRKAERFMKRLAAEHEGDFLVVK